MLDYEKLAEEFEQQTPEKKETAVAVKKEDGDGLSTLDVVGDTQQEILRRARDKINNKKIFEKHASKIAKITDEAMDADVERAGLKVQHQQAANKVEKQEIKNRLIALKAEAKRIRKAERQKNIEQKAEHKAKNKAAKWELYKDKLKRMKYDYVPNPVILSMLLFFDGVKSFFDGLGALSTAIVKALKWVLLIGAILIVLFSIPATREWIINILR